MYGIFVNENGGIRYADALVSGIKTLETRNRKMLHRFIGDRVAIVRTRKGKAPLVVGYVTITGAFFCCRSDFQKHFNQHLVPAGSAHDATTRGKWCYQVVEAEKADPYPLPANTIRHGRSWCEW